MRKITISVFYLFLLLAFLLSPLLSNNIIARENPEDKPYFNEIEKLRLKRGGLFNLKVDVQLGLSFSNTNFNLNRVDSTTQNLNNPNSRLGPNIGAIVTFDFLGFGFSSGLMYSSKGFETISGSTANFKYINIPLLFYFDFEIGKVIIDGNFGPYFGLLLSQNNDAPYVPIEVKNFDLGLTGDVNGAYMFQKHLGVLLGVKYEYGGLNNLGSNEAVKSIRTSTFFIYSGLKFVL